MSRLYPRELLTELIDDGRFKLGSIDRETLCSLVDDVFFASLIREEGEAARLAVVYDERGAAGLAEVRDENVHHEDDEGELAWDVTAIARLGLEVRALAKLSRGLEYGTQLVVVGGRGADLWIDGIARRSLRTDGGRSLRIAAPRAGILVFERHFEELLRYEHGERIRPAIDVLGEDGPVRQAVGRITGDPGSGYGYAYVESAIRRLLQRMRATEAGAILAILPETPDAAVLSRARYLRVETSRFRRRIEESKTKGSRVFSQRVAAHGKGLRADEVAAREAATDEADRASQALDAAIDDLARFSAIDGAVLLGPNLDVYGAGYLIPSGPSFEVVRALDAAVERTEPHPRDHGARHQAAFSFAYATGGVAFVISEDGPVSSAMRIGERVVVWPVGVSET